MARVKVGMAAVIERAQAAGSHFFDRDTVKYWGSIWTIDGMRMGNQVYFITRENRPDDMSGENAQVWTIRRINWATGRIVDIPEYRKFDSIEHARAELHSQITALESQGA